MKSKDKFFHGTNTDFDEFKIGMPSTRRTIDGDSIKIESPAAFVSKDKSVADFFAKGRSESSGSPVIKELFVNMENPIDFIDRKSPFANINPEVNDLLEPYGFVFDDFVDVQQALDDKDFVDLLKDLGYDGAILEETAPKIKRSESIAIFDPSRIKTRDQLREIWEQANKDFNPAGAAKVPKQIGELYTPKSKQLASIIQDSKMDMPIGTHKGKEFALGEFGKDSATRKAGKADRFPENELSETIKNIKSSIRASYNPKQYRYDNTVWISEMPDGELRAVYTRTTDGVEQIINWHKISAGKFGRFIKDIIESGE